MTLASQETATSSPSFSPRRRLIDGMAKAIALSGDRGYADVTLAEIVREAGVSRRTFYEHFANKDECLIALYEDASAEALNLLQAAIDPARDWEEQVEMAIGAYLGYLSGRPDLLRPLVIEILGLGKLGLSARRRVNRQIAGFMMEVINRSSSRHARPPISPELAVAVVGGINELLLFALDRETPVDINSIVPTASALLRGVVATSGY